MTLEIEKQVRSLASGVRAVVAVVTLILSYFNLRASWDIGFYQAVFRDMLSGKPYPMLTNLIFEAKPVFIATSLLLPLAAFAILYRVRNHKTALSGASGILLLIFIQIHILWTGLFAPLKEIFSSLTSAP